MNLLRWFLLVLVVTTTLSGYASTTCRQEKALWNNAQGAVAQGKFDVANLTLRTLLNTYPQTKYAKRAKKMLRDPRLLATCNAWSVLPMCDPVP